MKLHFVKILGNNTNLDKSKRTTTVYLKKRIEVRLSAIIYLNNW